MKFKYLSKEGMKGSLRSTESVITIMMQSEYDA